MGDWAAPFPGTEARPRVAVIEDHYLISASLGAALSADGFDVVVPTLANLAAAREELEALAPSVALLDLDLGDFGSGETLLPSLVSMGARVLIVSATTDEPTIGRCLQAGAWGFVSKTSPFQDLLAAIALAAAGRSVLDSEQRDRLLRAWREHQASTNATLAPFNRLSRREAQGPGLAAGGQIRGTDRQRIVRLGGHRADPGPGRTQETGGQQSARSGGKGDAGGVVHRRLGRRPQMAQAVPEAGFTRSW